MFALLIILVEIRHCTPQDGVRQLVGSSKVVLAQIISLSANALIEPTCRPDTFAKSAKLLREAAVKEKTLAQGG
jgi:hypothetical protein